MQLCLKAIGRGLADDGAQGCKAGATVLQKGTASPLPYGIEN